MKTKVQGYKCRIGSNLVQTHYRNLAMRMPVRLITRDVSKLTIYCFSNAFHALSQCVKNFNGGNKSLHFRSIGNRFEKAACSVWKKLMKIKSWRKSVDINRTVGNCEVQSFKILLNKVLKVRRWVNPLLSVSLFSFWGRLSSYLRISGFLSFIILSYIVFHALHFL